MINSIELYLTQLRKELNGSDRATIQDALADAEEYLRNALEYIKKAKPEISEPEALASIIQEYGTPEEIAAAYQKVEHRTSMAHSYQGERSLAIRFFGVVADPRAWGALLYLLIAMATGIIYFTWAVTGISISAGLLILIIGIPLAGIFLLSIRGLALVEGRLVEALLGIRMPRRPLFSNRSLSLWDRFKAIVTDKYTWFSLIYMILMLPLGIIYFTLFLTLISVSLFLAVRPILEYGFGFPIFNSYDISYYTPGWLMPIAVIGGVLLFFVTMHLAKIFGRMHSWLAKTMLVRE
jgi:uncharacterized membrane protein